MSSTIHQWLRRASTYLNARNRSETNNLVNEEVVFSKNNVCVHSFDKQTNELRHNSGYLMIKRTAIKSDEPNDHKWTLCLQWTPNQCLTKHLEVSSETEESLTNNNSLSGMEPIVKQIETKCDEVIYDWNNCNTETNSSLSPEIDIKRSNSISGHEYKVSGRLTSPQRAVRSLSCRSTPLKKNLVSEESINILNVDLKQIKSLRLFFGEDQSDSNADNSNGQLVIVSRHSFYKVFHFHCGGFDKLANALNDLDFWDKHETSTENKYLQFSICRPQLKAEECHPEEDLYLAVNESHWRDSINELGQVVNEQNLRKNIFFAGIERSMRPHIWPFLLHRYEFDSTYAERDIEDTIKTKQYYELSSKLTKMSDNERELFARNVESIIEKDVIRTDRSNPFFFGENNENIDIMKRILINFALYCPQMGYTQGMSDLLAPLLTEMQCEHKTFWCFVAMMTSTRFVCSPKDFDMDLNLTLLRELLRLMCPTFYAHIKQFSDDLELLFTHRWILLCFKREFKEDEAMRIWEACWAHFDTHFFHLFVCLAIISVYGKDVIDHNMDSDEMLFHFSTLSMNMNGTLILRKARGLFYEFNVLPLIPCTLKNLTKADLEMWDRSSEQMVECVKLSPNATDCRHLCQCNRKDQNCLTISSVN